MDVKISKEDMAALKDIAARWDMTQADAAAKLLHVGTGRQTTLNTFADAKKAERKAASKGKKPAKKGAKAGAKKAAKNGGVKKAAKPKAAKKSGKAAKKSSTKKGKAAAPAPVDKAAE